MAAAFVADELQKAGLYDERVQWDLPFRGQVLRCASLLREMHEPSRFGCPPPELTDLRDTRTRLGTKQGHSSAERLGCPRCCEDRCGLILLKAEHLLARLLSAPDRHARSRVRIE